MPRTAGAWRGLCRERWSGRHVGRALHARPVPSPHVCGPAAAGQRAGHGLPHRAGTLATSPRPSALCRRHSRPGPRLGASCLALWGLRGLSYSPGPGPVPQAQQAEAVAVACGQQQAVR